MKVKFKKLNPDAPTPKKAHPGDAGFDLSATSKKWDTEKKMFVYGTGLAVEVPEGHVGLLFPRSSICKTTMTLSNAVGVLDSNYRGEIKAFFRTEQVLGGLHYSVGDRIIQMIIVPYPEIELEEVSELSSTDRGSGGFGSSGA